MESWPKKEDSTLKEKLKNFWSWLWESESIWSYLVFLVLVFIFIKFIFLPGLSLLFGMGINGLPLAIVESSSMDHRALAINSGLNYEICGANFPSKTSLNTEGYWDTCGNWYEQNTNITKEEFKTFSFKNGFKKGDIMIIFGKKNVKIGDVIVYEAGSRHPIIHRVISLNPIQTKGDHNAAQLIPGNNAYGADERNVPREKIIGTAIARIPWLGWPKLFIVELWNKISG